MKDSVWTINTKYYTAPVQFVPARIDLKHLAEGVEHCVQNLLDSLEDVYPIEACIYYFEGEQVS